MKVKLLSSTPAPEIFIGKVAGICYGKENSDDETCIRRAGHCVDKGHLATLRFAHAVFRVSGISRACANQFVRSKHLDFLQRSQRYCDESESGVVIPSHILFNDELREEYLSAVNGAEGYYKKLISMGVKKEDARFVLPSATVTELVVVGNLQAFRDLIKLRKNNESQWEIRNVVIEIERQLNGIAPNVFKIS